MTKVLRPLESLRAKHVAAGDSVESGLPAGNIRVRVVSCGQSPSAERSTGTDA